MEKVDYDAVFDAYDVLNLKTVPYCYLIQGLNAVGVIDPQKVLIEKYPDIKETATIGKKLFVSIISAEHKSLGYSLE